MGRPAIVRRAVEPGRKVPLEMFRAILEEERAAGGPGSRFDEAAGLLDRLVSDDEFCDFLTEPAYDLVSAVAECREYTVGSELAA